MITKLFKRGGWNKRGGWMIFMKSINVEAGFCFCGGWNVSKSVIVDSTFISEMRVLKVNIHYYLHTLKTILQGMIIWKKSFLF